MESSHNYLLKIAYDGLPFYGWQKNNAFPSIEEELEKALIIILRKKPVLQAASRTDRGVHAEGQIVNFIHDQKIDLEKTLYKLNRILLPSIRVLEMKKMPLSFHPTLDAKSKTYHYYFSDSKILLPHKRHLFWHYPYSLDLSFVCSQFTDLIGEKNFSSFTNKKYVNPLCTLYNLEIKKLEDNHYLLIVEGNRFLYNMVRILAGTIIQIASKKVSLPLKTILEHQKREYAGITAPACGLVLKAIEYDHCN
jgi:tRNA pseudouridine38-40 synthase